MHDRQLHEYTRDRFLTEAIVAGKFGEERRSYWEAQYDRDPLVTAATIGAMAAPAQVPAMAAQHVHPVARIEADPGEEQVQAWTDQLFPETRPARELERQVQATGGAAYPRVMTDGKD
jgi:hypothetical protein